MNAAGTSRSLPGPRRSTSAPTSTDAGSCQLGPLMPSAPTTTVRGASVSRSAQQTAPRHRRRRVEASRSSTVADRSVIATERVGRLRRDTSSSRERAGEVVRGRLKLLVGRLARAARRRRCPAPARRTPPAKAGSVRHRDASARLDLLDVGLLGHVVVDAAEIHHVVLERGVVHRLADGPIDLLELHPCRTRRRRRPRSRPDRRLLGHLDRRGGLGAHRDVLLRRARRTPARPARPNRRHGSVRRTCPDPRTARRPRFVVRHRLDLHQFLFLVVLDLDRSRPRTDRSVSAAPSRISSGHLRRCRRRAQASRALPCCAGARCARRPGLPPPGGAPA